ncbi:MBL fold metallo-hydrolase [Microbacterium abyssi]|uniref:MBL fold metallo-hydrolase n=1 Tax=Microbacterium abyssi TaxID=2782166 RepID=UPI0018895832|nr:MBL fold metallo-hydrolase [Microbacterium sp. A18JL241]
MIAESITTLNPAHREAWDAGRVADPENLGDGLWSVPLELPGDRMPGSYAYVIDGADGVHIIDPGWNSDANMGRIVDLLTGLGRAVDEVSTVVVTHHHPDHLGLAERLRSASGAHVILSAVERRVIDAAVSVGARDDVSYRDVLDRWEVPVDRQAELIAAFTAPSLIEYVMPDAEVADGDVLVLGGRRLTVIATPGHTSGHICLADRERRMIFTGDHVLPRIHSGAGLGILVGDDPLGDLLASLERLAEFDDCQVLPGHEFRFTGLGQRRAQIAAHHLRRTRVVASLSNELGDASVWEWSKHLPWTAGWANLRGFRLHSALRQTEMHRDLVRSGRAEKWLSRG